MSPIWTQVVTLITVAAGLWVLQWSFKLWLTRKLPKSALKSRKTKRDS